MNKLRIDKEEIINASVELLVLLLAWASYYQNDKINDIAHTVWGLVIGIQLMLLGLTMTGLVNFKKLPEPYVPWKSCLCCIIVAAYADLGLTAVICSFLVVTWSRHIVYRSLHQLEEQRKAVAELKSQLDLLAVKEMLDSLGIDEEDLKDNNIDPVKLNSVSKKINM